MQVFNFLNARKIHEEKNIFQGIFRNNLFIGIVVGIALLQILIGTFGNRPFNVAKHGMNIVHWLIAVGFGAFSLIVCLILKLIPVDRLCPKAGKKMTDPLQSSSKIMSVKRSHNEEKLHRKFSSLNRVDAKGNSLTKVQYHAVGN